MEARQLAGVLGIGSLEGFTLRELRQRVDGHERAWRERLYGFGLLMVGEVPDVQLWIETGRVHVPVAQPIDPEIERKVRRYSRAIELNGGRYLMPDAAERILAAHGEE